MNDIYSFYQLISKYQVEIPIIQRDYAQGRDNAKAADVRKSLVTKMIDAVKNDKTLFFDFVYGRIDDNKFIPFDGQQRLTTLFLFHKYVFEKCQSDSDCSHKGNCICKDILNRFSYATRQSSREFCDKLVQENIVPSGDRKISENITNQSWFYPDWHKDPTVMGMLTMLDEIHRQMKDKNDFKTFAEKLTSGCNCPITFHFVDMGEHKMSDETYVKMNARGKQLTPFENFKASLEQYLEEKSKPGELITEEQKKLKVLLRRLKGVSDEGLQEYAGIDGPWLDLFWKVTNTDKAKIELSDTLMMSFFNRHFMNVWRCWYTTNSKSDNDRKSLSEDEINKQNEWDSFNDIIQKGMPLYPTKDDFVSFDIYRFVMDNCGVDNCLTPIFNICDALFTNQENIKNNCQAVWNRDKKKLTWNLYQGDNNNNNRETYPSRVAFYALMEYFATSTDVASLDRWMRVVWNIIENATIDSSDTYQSALKLIEKLSTKSHSIYNALAKDFESFELGNQYFAKEQVAEEIAKSTQILDENGELRKYKGNHKKKDGTEYNTWEEIIIDAEKYAFFKGAIRFLFQDGNGNIDWNNFDTKLANAQKYFDENGVKDGITFNQKYKTNSLLMKSLLANGDWNNIWYWFEFSNDAAHWRRILTDAKWKKSVDKIMSTDITPETNKSFVDILTDDRIKNLVDDDLMNFICNEMSGARLRSTYHSYYAIWKSGYPAGQVVLNPILSNLSKLEEITYRNDCAIEKSIYYRCQNHNLDFKYTLDGKDYYFQWWGKPVDKQVDVYLMEDNWTDYKKRQKPTTDKNTEEDTHFCFKVTPEMGKTTTPFTDELKRLINEAILEKQ